MKDLSLIALLILFSFKVNAQIYKKNLSIADVINGRSNIEVYDYIQNKKVDKEEYIAMYGNRFYKDIYKISKSMRYSSEESMRNFQEAIAMRQQKIENNREEWNRLRNTNMRYLRTGKALITLSTISAGVTIPVILSKMTKDATNYVVHGEGTYTGNMNKIDRRTKSCVITGVVCGIGELAGIFCIARYRTHRNEYDPPFYFTPALNEEGIGFSFMKNF